MYILVVLINMCFCMGLTLQLFFQRTKEQAMKPFMAQNGTVTKSTSSGNLESLKGSLSLAKERKRQLKTQVRKLEQEKKNLLYKLEEDKRMREKLQAKLEEEKLVRDSLQARLKSSANKTQRAEQERDTLRAMLENLCNNTNAMEKLVQEMRTVQAKATEKANSERVSERKESEGSLDPVVVRFESLKGRPRKDVSGIAISKQGSSKGLLHLDMPKNSSVLSQLPRREKWSDLQPQDSPQNISTSSVCSVESSLVTMKSCDSFSTLNNCGSVLTDDFHESRMRQSEIYNEFELDSDAGSL